MTLRRSKTYYKYLLSYVALLLTAVLALLLFSQAFFIVQLRSSLNDVHRSRLRQTVQQLDNDIQQLYAIDYQISSVNENFLSYYFADPSPMRDLRIVNEFKNTLAPSVMIEELALVDAHTNLVYTSTAAYAKSIFFDSIFSFDQWETPLEDLKRFHTRIVRPAERINNTERYITFINAPSAFSRLQDAVLMFFVREDHFLSNLSSENSPSQHGAIFDNQGNLIVSTFPVSSVIDADKYRIDGKDYIVFREYSSVIDWTYVFLLPASKILAPLHRAQIIVVVFILALLAAGTLVIHYAMLLNYKPIKDLTESLGRSGGDDLESLKDVIGSLSTQNESMRAQLMSSPDGQALKDSLLFSLLKGKFASFEDFNQEAAALNMSFTKPCYQVLMLRLFDQDAGAPRQPLNAAFAECFAEDFTWHFRDLFEQSMFVCLVGMDADKEAHLAKQCNQLLNICAEKYGLTFSIGASNCYSDIAHLTTACYEATQAVREHFIRGRHQYIPYSDLSRTLTSQTHHLSMLTQLTAQTPQQQMETIRQFVEALKADKVPALLAKSYCNSAVQLLISNTSQPVNMEDMFTITYLRTADDYLAFMLHMLDSKPEPIPVPEAPAGSSTPELLARIYAILAECYDDCNFSVQDVANRLSLTTPYLSQYFKQQTGETLTGYVASLRISKAQSLIESTTMPLQMVSESVGYYNLNSFIRRFKQFTGMTPGEYRKTHQ